MDASEPQILDRRCVSMLEGSARECATGETGKAASSSTVSGLCALASKYSNKTRRIAFGPGVVECEISALM